MFVLGIPTAANTWIVTQPALAVHLESEVVLGIRAAVNSWRVPSPVYIAVSCMTCPSKTQKKNGPSSSNLDSERFTKGWHPRLYTLSLVVLW